jgi:FkbM family methyltransferase
MQPLRSRDRTDNEHLRLLLAFTLRADSNCIDIGCNHGLVLADIVDVAPLGVHYAFEPVPELAEELARRFPAVDVRQVALSDRSGTASFAHVVDSDGLSGLSDRDLAETHAIRNIEVEICRLDDVLPADYAPAFVKIDVEGAELQVLEGSREPGRRCERIIRCCGSSTGIVRPSSTARGPTTCGTCSAATSVTASSTSDGAGPYTRSGFDALAGVPIWTFAAR